MTGLDKIKVEKCKLAVELRQFQGHLHLCYLIELIFTLMEVHGYNPEKMVYPIGWLMRFYAILNKIRGLPNDFFLLNYPQQKKGADSDEFKFILKLLKLYEIEQKLDELQKGVVKEQYKEDLEVYWITNNPERFSVLEENLKKLEMERIKLEEDCKKLQDKEMQGISLTSAENKLLKDLVFNQLSIFEFYFIAMTSELTRKELGKFKKVNPITEYNNLDKVQKIAEAIYRLRIYIETNLRLWNEESSKYGNIFFIYHSCQEFFIDFFERRQVTSIEYIQLKHFYLCPFIRVGKYVLTSPVLLSFFQAFLNYYIKRDELSNAKEEFFQEECLEILKPLEAIGIKIHYNINRKDQLDLILYNPNKNELFLIECTDYAPLYVPYIEKKKEEIREKTKNQLERKMANIQTDPILLNSILGLKELPLFHLVGISRIKCRDYDHIKFYTIREIKENPRIIFINK